MFHLDTIVEVSALVFLSYTKPLCNNQLDRERQVSSVGEKHRPASELIPLVNKKNKSLSRSERSTKNKRSSEGLKHKVSGAH